MSLVSANQIERKMSKNRNGSTYHTSLRLPWEIKYDLDEAAIKKGISRAEEILIRCALHKHDVVKREELVMISELQNELAESNAKVIELQNRVEELNRSQLAQVVVDENEIRDSCMAEIKAKTLKRFEEYRNDISILNSVNEVLEFENKNLLAILNTVDVNVLPNKKTRKKKKKIKTRRSVVKSNFKVGDKIYTTNMRIRKLHSLKPRVFGDVVKVFDLQSGWSYQVEFPKATRRMKDEELKK